MDNLNDIISSLKWGELSPTDAHNRILILFDVVNQRELLLKEQSDWLMTQTKLPVEKIVEFTQHFKQ